MPHAVQTKQTRTTTAAFSIADRPDRGIHVDSSERMVVLAADDHAATRRAHQRLLRHCGLDARVANDGLEAIAVVLDARDRGEPVQLILMDLDMPVVDGWSATASLRAVGYEGTIIAVSGSADPDVRSRCMTSGFDAFVAKPTTVDHLMSMVNSFVKKPARQADESEQAAMAGSSGDDSTYRRSA